MSDIFVRLKTLSWHCIYNDYNENFDSVNNDNDNFLDHPDNVDERDSFSKF